MNQRNEGQNLTAEEAKKLLQKSAYGVMATVSDDGRPYGIPMHFAYVEEAHAIYVHASNGLSHKKMNILHNDHVTLTLVDDDMEVKETIRPHYQSLIVFGNVEILRDQSEKQKGREALLDKYISADQEKERDYQEESLATMDVWKISIEKWSMRGRIE